MASHGKGYHSHTVLAKSVYISNWQAALRKIKHPGTATSRESLQWSATDCTYGYMVQLSGGFYRCVGATRQGVVDARAV